MEDRLQEIRNTLLELEDEEFILEIPLGKEPDYDEETV